MSLDLWNDPTGFSFSIYDEKNRAWPGGEITRQGATLLEAKLPSAGRLRLIRDGRLVKEEAKRSALQWDVDLPGVYRIEARQYVSGRWRPWIYSNPIWVNRQPPLAVCKLSLVKIFFLLNPSRVKNRWDWREAAARHAKRYGWTPRFGEVDRALPQSTDRLIDQALEEDCSRIVVVGGDGSLHRVINALAQKKKLKSIELAVVPAGTCNDFARFIGLRRRRLDQAFRVACGGKAQPTDLGVMGSELFLNNAGFGRKPAASRKRWKSVSGAAHFSPDRLARALG